MDITVPVVNAFVANGHGGNPAGVVLNAERLTDTQMQAIATHIGASESAFVLPSITADYELRFFTPTVEVSLCGHATIATWSYMFAQGKVQHGAYSQATLAGQINIDIDGSGFVFMEQPAQQMGEEINASEISNSLDIPNDWLNPAFTPQIVQGALMLSLKSKDLLNAFQLHKPGLLALNGKYGFEALHLFVMTPGTGTLASVRNFDPAVGIDEDAATGTTNGSFLTYLQHHNALPEDTIYKIEQGEALGQLSFVYGKFQSGHVWIGGTGVPTKTLDITL